MKQEVKLKVKEEIKKSWRSPSTWIQALVFGMFAVSYPINSWWSYILGVITLVYMTMTTLGTFYDQDERQRYLKFQSDSISLVVIILTLLILSVIYPNSDYIFFSFWIVIGVGLLGRIISALYQKFKGL